MKLNKLLLAAVAATATAGLASQAIGLEVTPQRLVKAQSEPQNWLLPYGSYNAHNHSNLSQINRSNVANLKVAFMHSIGGTNTSTPDGAPPTVQMVPVVNEGFMYLANGWAQMLKIDVRSGSYGQTLWMHDAGVESGATVRGSVALLGDYAYQNTRESNPRLIKIDTETGETVWEVSIKVPEDQSTRGEPSVQPMAIMDQIFVANRGTRGSIAAYSQDGAENWRFWTVPGPGEPGHESWKGDWGAWKTGGAPVWTQASYDPETNLVYYGTAEAKPWGDPEFRPGDNLYANSIVALDAATGDLSWYYQMVPNDTHDRDNVQMRMLYNVAIDGVERTALGQFTRGGFYYTLDRTSGDFLSAAPYTYVNWTAGIDSKTGKPVEYNPTALVQMYGNNKSVRAAQPDTSQNVCPNWIGSPTLMPPTFDASRMTAYIGAANGCFDTAQEEFAEKVDVELGQRRSFPGVTLHSIGRQQGRIVAVDVRTGDVVGESFHPWPLYSGTLGTAGDLLFTAQADGKIMAIDKETLAELWSFHVGTPISAPPMTYAVNGKQYVAIAVGGALYRPNDFNTQELTILQRNAQIVVFGL